MKCSEDLLEMVGQDVMECVRREQEISDVAVVVFPGTQVFREERVCVMVARIVERCTSMWRNCYTQQEVSIAVQASATRLSERIELLLPANDKDLVDKF